MKNPKIKLSRYRITRGSKVYYVGEVLNTRTNDIHYAMFFATDSRIEELTPAYSDLESAQMALDIMADDMGWRWYGAFKNYPRYKIDRRKLYKEKLWSF